ncbi:MAG: hypothetical protein AAGB23_13625 [Pseudomonadota bacterium]
MNRSLTSFALVAASALVLSACSTVQSVLDEGRGPFDQSPATTSKAALEGLHESSWGNSGKWGGEQPPKEEAPPAEPTDEDPPEGG